ncbi:hypothetical protein F2P81_018397 [Scophthalmus maximus]|uniref:Uncharacterized protein n=1 Tax=Scophthalmus maximus TaxID=52904 RepID=A0A6A4SFZ1_SCOMX|nr:hypothetical protein F2P81_018397 [Scophthalmus maximus]
MRLCAVCRCGYPSVGCIHRLIGSYELPVYVDIATVCDGEDHDAGPCSTSCEALISSVYGKTANASPTSIKCKIRVSCTIRD